MRNALFLLALPLVAIVAIGGDDERPAVTDLQMEKQWFYRSAGFESRNYATMGRAGNVVAYTLSTPDEVEDVIKWYSTQIGLSEEHTLMAAAKGGFANLEEDLHGDWQIYNDTDQSKNATLVLANASPEHVHVTIYHRPSFASQQSITISISKTPSGTSIAVVYPKPAA